MEADASADTYTLALADGAADSITNPSADAAALTAANASTDAEPVALADRDARKPDGGARLRSDAAADVKPDEQPDGSSGLLLLGRRLRRLHGAVGSPGLLERKRSVRDLLRSLVRWILARTAADAATDTGARARGVQCAGGVPGSRRRSRPPGRPLPCLCRIVCPSCYS